MKFCKVFLLAIAALLFTPGNHLVRAGEVRQFVSGSLIIPMDLAYQDHGMFQAYGLVFQLLRQGVKVYWVIDPQKTWHRAPCNTPGDECPWDCFVEDSGQKCPYPTASPDFYLTAKVVWDGEGRNQPGDVIGRHGYRGGPFVIDAVDAARARPIIDAWNDKSLWSANPWAQRTVFQVVSVHEATEAFSGYVRKEMVAAPTIAVFSDGNEHIATSYLRAAGIPQSNGREFPADKCDRVPCGPGTENPDMLTVPSIMGDMGTCDAPNYDHKNGALFTADGIPAYCQIMSMHWNVADRETVLCDDGACPTTQAQCAGKRITYHGHEVVAEVRQFLAFPVHFFAECQAVNAYENTVPNPAWPYLDDEGRMGHYLTTVGVPPDCQNGTCSDPDFQCVQGGCDAGARDCCIPKDIKERGAGFMIADRPATEEVKIIHPEVPYNQLDGLFGTVGGSEEAYNLSAFLGTAYKNHMEVVFITGPQGPGVQDVWMTGYLDGECDITSPYLDVPVECQTGKVSYLGGHRYETAVPLSQFPANQGTRMFLNALFEADCVTSSGQPEIALNVVGPTELVAEPLPAVGNYTASFLNAGAGTALEALLVLGLPDGVFAESVGGGGQIAAGSVTWQVGSIGSAAARPGEPANSGAFPVRLSFAAEGAYTLSLTISFRVGVSTLTVGPVTLRVEVTRGALDGGYDAGTDAGSEGSADGGADPSDEEVADAGGDGESTNAASGCGCATQSPAAWPALLLAMILARRLRRQD